CQQYDSDPYSF
nr:immunoglobulin light chain junction region [Macaca mulatta]MOV75287.1 immunoglobulin light chain junction region [Macaca mulatta]MOV75565.1 immunoglobulin light chain junction region [Macaca mulatta]MOV75955.1 immunoglobulin light chain junction region [Macaca mulatta]MOV76160.1 immunoglobulin light chain junction region [Macaca mulatta]